MTASPTGKTRLDILSLNRDGITAQQDDLAVEEALEIRVAGAEPVITMRTPGHDRELVAGLLLSEGLVRRHQDLASLSPLLNPAGVMQVELARPDQAPTNNLQRSSLSNSACGVCGKRRLNLELLDELPPLPPSPRVSSEILNALPTRLAALQQLFSDTGGLHAAALFDQFGKIVTVREDVGRHNALDKLLGWALLQDQLPLENHIVLLSGRASFELIQKCIMARVAMVCAISAPSSYAVELARKHDITLVGFLRQGRFNIYAAAHRIQHQATASINRCSPATAQFQ
jgi:FdhD protein